MNEQPDLVRVTPTDGKRQVAVRSAPEWRAPEIGEVSAGSCLLPIGHSRDGHWLAVAWAGGTGWLPTTSLMPVSWAASAPATFSAGLPFDWPVGAVGARHRHDLPPGWYIATGFAETYRPAPGQHAVHTGLDLNLRSGGDTDLGQPVFATADGLVTASGAWPVWGNIVLVRHDLPDGGRLWSQYAHLQRRLVATGQVVHRGDQVGTIGKGQGNRFSAHLHFEIRRRNVPASYWPGLNRAAVLATYVDPQTVIATGPASAATSASYPLVGVQIAAERTLPAALAAGEAGWVVLVAAVGDDPTRVPTLDVSGLAERGLRVVLQLVPRAAAGAPDGARLGAGFGRAAAEAVRGLVGTPWAVLLGGDWDTPAAWPVGTAVTPEQAAACYNQTADAVREALADTERPEVLVGPGPLARHRGPHDPRPFWTAMLAAMSDVDVLALRAWTLGEAPALATPPDADTLPWDPFNQYRTLLAAVPARLVSRPALLVAVDATEPRGQAPTGWLPAVVANVRAWNTAGQGPTVRGVVLGDWLTTDWPPVDDLPGDGPTRPAARPAPRTVFTEPRPVERPAWCGTGLFVRSPWPPANGAVAAARRVWRAAELDFVVIKACHHDQVYLAAPEPWRVLAGEPDVPRTWGWGTVAGARPSVEAALAADCAERLAAAGWVVEPVAGYPPAAAAAFMLALRAALAGRPLGLAWRADTPAAVVAAFAPAADVLMPQLARTGALGEVLAAVARFDRPVVPVLQLGDAPTEETVAAFLAHAVAAGRPGAAVLVDDGWSDVPGRGLLPAAPATRSLDPTDPDGGRQDEPAQEMTR